MFARSNEDNRTVSSCNSAIYNTNILNMTSSLYTTSDVMPHARAQRSSSFRVAIEFRDDDRRNVNFLLESARLCLARLADRRVHDVHDVLRVLKHNRPNPQRLASNIHVALTSESGLTTVLETCNISSNNESSCLCRPLVSTMMISKLSFLNLSTPSAAITTGSVSV